MSNLSALDWVVIGLYFMAVLAIAVWATLKERKGGEETSADYFLAGRHAGWFVIGASLFASNIGAEHLVGLAGSGASGGVAVGQFEIQASLILLLLGWVFVPFYLRSGVFTMPEFLERRYSPAARWYLAIVSIIGYVLTKISVNIAAGGIVFTALGVDFWTGALIVVVATGVYTVFGGMRAVLYTDLLQMFVFVGGAGAVTILGLRELGGWNKMLETAGPEYFNMWQPMTHPDFPWTGILFGAPVLGIWYWCTDQFIVQRVLSARDQDQARKGTIMAAFLKLTPLFLFVIPGIIAHCLAKTGRLELATPDLALPTLVKTLLPSGLRGLVVAGLLAAIMSSLSSVYNSCSTLVTWDIYKKLSPGASERQLVLVGQLSTVLMVVFGLAWIPLMKDISPQIYSYLQSVQAYIAPPIAAVFLVGICWKRVNSAGAMVSLLTGFVLGMGRLVLELNKKSLGDGLLLDIASMNFLHFAVLLLAICTSLLIIVSLLTPPEDERKLSGLTFATVPPLTAADRPTAAVQAQQRLNIGLSVVIVGLVCAIWLYFRG